MGYERHDSWYLKAKKEQLRARSAFKLDEIQRRLKLVRSGDRVVDLGAAPGGFLQVLAQIVGPRGLVIGVDIEEIRPLAPPVFTIHADIFEASTLESIRQKLAGAQASVVTSDLAPKTSGIRAADEARSVAMVERALQIAEAVLAPGGHFAAKVFMGPGFDDLRARLQRQFEEVRIVRPEATRTHSRETYLVGLRRRA